MVFYRSHLVRGNDWNSWQGSEAASSVGCIRDSNAPIASKLRWFASAEPPYEIKDDSFELTLTVRPELVEGRGKVLASIHGSTSSPRTESGVVSDTAF